MKKRRAVAAAALIVGALALTACSRGGSGGSPDDHGPITIW